MTGIELLKAVREKISDKERWTEGAFARTAGDIPVDPRDPAAVCWCVIGAAIAVEGSSTLANMGGGMGWDELIGTYLAEDVNDQKGHKAVLDLLDKRIAELEAKR